MKPRVTGRTGSGLPTLSIGAPRGSTSASVTASQSNGHACSRAATSANAAPRQAVATRHADRRRARRRRCSSSRADRSNQPPLPSPVLRVPPLTGSSRNVPGVVLNPLLVQRRASTLARGFDDPHHPQAIHHTLGEEHPATKQRRQLTSGKRTRWERRQEAQNVVPPPQLDAIEHVDQPPLSCISRPPAGLHRSHPTDMILP